MNRMLRACTIDVLVGLPKNIRLSPLGALKRRHSKIVVFSDWAPFWWIWRKDFCRLKAKNTSIVLAELITFAEQQEGKVLSLFAGTPEAEAFILQNSPALEPFYRICQKGDTAYDT